MVKMFFSNCILKEICMFNCVTLNLAMTHRVYRAYDFAVYSDNYLLFICCQ